MDVHMDSTLKSARPPRIWSLRGPEGIRSGWSFLIFVLIYGLISFGLFTLARILFHLNGIAGDPYQTLTLALTGSIGLLPVGAMAAFCVIKSLCSLARVLV